MHPSSAEKFAVLSDATRLAVVEALLQRPRHVSELCERISVEQSRMSHHLQILRSAGIVRAARDGQRMIYSLHPNLDHHPPSRELDLGCCRIAFGDPQ